MKTKFFVPAIIIASVAVATFLSCSKNTTVNPSTPANTQAANSGISIYEQGLLTQMKQSKVDPNTVKSRAALLNLGVTGNAYANPLNPYDEVGLVHNQVLDAVKAYIPNLNSNSTLTLTMPSITNPTVMVSSTYTTQESKTIGIVEKFMLENYISSLSNSTTNAQINSELTTTENYFFQNPFPGITTTNPTAATVTAFTDNMNTKLQYFQTLGLTPFEVQADNLLTQQLTNSDDINIDVAFAIVLNYETLIINSSLSSTVKQRQLTFTSILRYSMGYWNSTINDPSSPWLTYMANVLVTTTGNGGGTGTGQLSSFFKKFLKIVLIGLADAAGGGIGALISSPIGAAIVGGFLGGVASTLAGGPMP